MATLLVFGVVLFVAGLVTALVNMWQMVDDRGGSFGRHFLAMGLFIAGSCAMTASAVWWLMAWLSRH
jgi:hypothetical protein